MRTIKILTALAFVLLMCGAAQAAYIPTSDTSAVVTGIDPVTGLATKVYEDSGALRVTGSVTATVSGTVTATLPETVAISAAAVLPVTIPETIGVDAAITSMPDVRSDSQVNGYVILIESRTTMTYSHSDTVVISDTESRQLRLDIGDDATADTFTLIYVSADTDVYINVYTEGDLMSEYADAGNGTILYATGGVIPYPVRSAYVSCRSVTGLQGGYYLLRAKGMRQAR